MAIVLAALSLLISLVGLIVAVAILLHVRRPVGRELGTALRDELRTSREEAARQARARIGVKSLRIVNCEGMSGRRGRSWQPSGFTLLAT